MKYQKILFDLDGTISDPKIGITKSFQYALAFFGISVESLDELEPVIGPPLKQSFMEFYHLTEEDTLVAIEKYRERFGKKGLYENTLYPGMKELLEQLKDEGFELAIASSKPTLYVEQILEYFEIRSCFSHVVGAYMDGRRGEKEEVVEDAIVLLGGEKEKGRMIMVGDRKFDILGAHQNGLPAVGVTYGYGGKQELSEAGADILVDSVAQLREALLGHE